MHTFMLKMQNIVATLNWKALKIFVINITVFLYIYMTISQYLCINLHKSKGLPKYIKISIIPLSECSTLDPSQ